MNNAFNRIHIRILSYNIGFTILIIYSLIYIIFKKKFSEILLILSAMVNVLFLPLSLLISTLPTEDSDGRNIFTFFSDFFYFQGVPLVWFVLSFFIYKRFTNKSKLFM